MPFKSKDQAKKFFAMEGRGELPKGTAEKWAHHTPGGIKDLPEKKGKGKPKGRKFPTNIRKAAALRIANGK